jgi:hypothetical protein
MFDPTCPEWCEEMRRNSPLGNLPIRHRHIRKRKPPGSGIGQGQCRKERKISSAKKLLIINARMLAGKPKWISNKVNTGMIFERNVWFNTQYLEVKKTPGFNGRLQDRKSSLV